MYTKYVNKYKYYKNIYVIMSNIKPKLYRIFSEN